MITLGRAVLASALSLVVAGAAQTQSLGELAAREAVRRAAITKPSPVHTSLWVTRPDRPTVPPSSTPAVAAPGPATLEPSARSRPIFPAAVPDLPAAFAAVPAPVLTSPAVVIPDHTRSAIPAPTSLARPVAPPQPAANTPSSQPSLQRSPSSPLTGWSAFQIRKTPAELAETARLAEVPQFSTRTRATDIKLPPQHDALRLSTGVGYLLGADFGGDVTASGKINGMQTDVSAFLTGGPIGFQSRNGRLSIYSPGGDWRGEGGDMYSDLRGIARGARVSWSARQTWTPSLAVYLPNSRTTSNGSVVLAYRDRYQLFPRVRVGGELTSDGDAFVQWQYADPRLDLTAFYRSTRTPISGQDQGLSGGVGLGRGVAVSGAIRISDAVGDASQWQLASIRLPLARQASVTLERSWWSGSSDDGSTNALTLQLPLGPVRIIQRLQWGRTDYRQRAVPFGFDRRQSQSTASYSPGPWGSVNYQQSTQWFDDGRMQQWDEVASVFQIHRRTSVQFVTAFPDIWEPRRLRARVRHQLSPTLVLEAQYGRLSAFQMTRATESEESRAMITIRKTWEIQSPARGGDVRGRTTDQAGRAVSGALVRLGPFSAITDEDGGYRFTRVPKGEFELALDRNKLPVAYAWDEKPRAVDVERGSRMTIDLQVTPLDAIRGRVYADTNRNGQYDEGEGVANAVVEIDGVVTATSATGAYGFYNRPPGRYTVRLDVPRLAKGLVPASPVVLLVELTADRPLAGADFTVEKRDMPILMREIGR